MVYDPNKFPIGPGRKSEVIKKEERRQKYLEDPSAVTYGWVDSPLDYSKEGKFLNARGEPFFNTFKRILPREAPGLRAYIEETLKEKKGEAVGIEFGGPGAEAFTGFSEGFFKKSAGVVLVDHRPFPKVGGLGLSQENTPDTHTVFLQDVLAPKTYADLTEWIGADKADFIIERMGAGLDLLPTDPYTAAKLLQTWYGLLSPGGLMLVQTPPALDPLLGPWSKRVLSEHAGTIEVKYALHRNDFGDQSVLRIHKLPGAPESLPLLAPKEVRDIATGK